MDLRDTVGVVTGGGTGIGAAIARSLVAGGASGVLVGYTRSREAAAETAAGLRAAGARAEAVQVDVQDDAAVRALADRCEELFGRCDVLVNNAGATAWVPPPDLEGLTDDVWHSVLDVNVVGAFRCARALGPQLTRSRGVVVNIGSISAYRGIGSSIAYAVSKAALLQLTRSLATAMAPAVRVVSLSPGNVDTRWQRDHHGAEAFRAMVAREEEVVPLGRIVGPDDVASAVMGLLAADMVTGVDVVVDGGKHLRY